LGGTVVVVVVVAFLIVVVIAQLVALCRARRSVVVPSPFLSPLHCCCHCSGLAASRLHPMRSCSQRWLAILPPVIHPANRCEQWQWGSLYLPLILVVLPISTPRAVAHGSSWGCCRGVSLSLLFIVPLSTLQAGAGSGGVGVGGAISCLSAGGGSNVAGGSYLVVFPLPWAP
jgi:uncharacterized membrane protein YgcG